MLRQSVAVIGAGTIGSQVALNLALFGHEVTLKDVDPARLEAAKAAMHQQTRLLKMTQKEMPPFYEDFMSRIRFTTAYDGFGEVDLVIENIPEDWPLKEALYREMQGYCSESTIYAVNTSCISVSAIGRLLPRPDRVVGMHFMNPVVMKNLVEVIRGDATSDDTIHVARQLLKSMQKNMVVVKDTPGFVSNRLSHLLMNEAMLLVQESVCTPQGIDAILRKGFGHAMGPLETADLIGLDTVANSLDILYGHGQDPKFKCSPLLLQMVEAGHLGRKSGKGFYDYN